MVQRSAKARRIPKETVLNFETEEDSWIESLPNLISFATAEKLN